MLSFFSNTKENAKFTLLKKALPNEINLEQIREIYFLTAIEYNEQNLIELKLSIKENRIKKFLQEKKFDSLKDSLEVYFFLKNDNTHFLGIMVSPVEFFENEYFLECYNFQEKIELTEFLDLKKVYNKNISLPSSNKNR